MAEKTKRKRAASRPIWQIVAPIVLIILLVSFGSFAYFKAVSVKDAGKIVFLRAEESNTKTPNIYIRDVGDEEGEARALTDYHDDTTISQFDVSPDGTWLVYDEQAGDKTKLWKLDIETGEKTLIWDCLVKPLQYCWGAKLSPDGNTLMFAGADNVDFYEGLGILDLTAPDAVPELLFEGDIFITDWIGNNRLLYWSWEDDGMFFYDIATGETEAYESDTYWVSVNADGSLVTQSMFSYDSGTGNPSWAYQVLDTVNDAEMTYQLSVGDPQQAVLDWNPSHTQMLIKAMDSGDGYVHNQVYLFDTETEELSLLFGRKEYRVHELQWNSDGTAFLMNIESIDQYSEEGQLWIYDMKSGEAKPLNEIGRDVQWVNQ
jgi:WD40 repeat protein